MLIREFSETLISELASRDELEYEKELKNSFISLLLSVQSKRRQYYVEKRKLSKQKDSNQMHSRNTNRSNNETTAVTESKVIF